MTLLTQDRFCKLQRLMMGAIALILLYVGIMLATAPAFR
jgi:hypothetical protein